jgi:hypothetical protein
MATDKKFREDWMNRKWRPAMGWTYMVICILDFAIFPIAWSILQAMQGGEVTSQWLPITLQGAGLFHVAMGAILGIAAWSRGKEKLAGLTEDDTYQQPRHSRRERNDRYYSNDYVDHSPSARRRGTPIPLDNNFPEI